jgi:hypothetical protein
MCSGTVQPLAVEALGGQIEALLAGQPVISSWKQ